MKFDVMHQMKACIEVREHVKLKVEYFAAVEAESSSTTMQVEINIQQKLGVVVGLSGRISFVKSSQVNIAKGS